MWTRQFVRSLRIVIRRNEPIREGIVCRQLSTAIFSANNYVGKQTAMGSGSCLVNIHRGVKKSVSADAGRQIRGDRSELGLDENDVDDEWMAPQSQPQKPRGKSGPGTKVRESKKSYATKQNKSPARAVAVDEDDDDDASDADEEQTAKKTFKKRPRNNEGKLWPCQFVQETPDNFCRAFQMPLSRNPCEKCSMTIRCAYSMPNLICPTLNCATTMPNCKRSC